MGKITFSNKFWLIIALSLSLVIPFNNAFARGGPRGGPQVIRGGPRGHDYYRYRDRGGYRYNSGWFWGSFATGLVIGSVVARSPSYRETVYVNSAFVEAPDVVYVPSVNQPQVFDRETVIINVPSRNGGSIAITLVRQSNGFVGPQGEFYSALPTAEQLRVRYGR
ncbi:MAG: hypothetical protein NTZ92_03070 [Candidatus Omnitrophica bacterium]|nr:hypothetical protein [Candidatus Omnitrophota bacterium]